MPKILTIEDSLFERKAIMGILEEEGYTDILEAGDAEEGLEIYKQKKPDLVLLDLRLPGMDGLDCLKELKKLDPNVQVIIVTIITRKDSIERANQLGAKGYVVKPITKDKIIPQIEKILKSKSS